MCRRSGTARGLPAPRLWLFHLLLTCRVGALEYHAGHEAQHATTLARRDRRGQRRPGHRQKQGVQIAPDGSSQRLQALTPLEDMSSEYTGAIGVGTAADGGPQFKAHVVFDTGSTNLWVASVLCKVSPCNEDRSFYDPAQSVTSEMYEGDQAKDIDIMFGTGELRGPLHVDTYRVGPMKVDKQPFAMIREMSGEVFGSFPFEGILGLAFPSLSFGGIEPFFERVIRKKLLKNNEFAFYLNAESSQPSALLWGGVDKGLYEGSIVMVPVALPHYWALELVDFRIGNRSLMDTDHSAKKYLVIDTGTTYFTAPDSIYDAVMAQFPEVPCSQAEAYPPLTYVLRSGDKETYDLEVKQETYMVGDDANFCVPAFMKLDVKKQYGPALILGEVFMRHFFTVFSRGSGNLSEARVGFAKARAGATPKVPVMRRNPSI